jgi:hypothetical protein
MQKNYKSIKLLFIYLGVQLLGVGPLMRERELLRELEIDRKVKLKWFIRGTVK